MVFERNSNLLMLELSGKVQNLCTVLQMNEIFNDFVMRNNCYGRLSWCVNWSHIKLVGWIEPLTIILRAKVEELEEIEKSWIYGFVLPPIGFTIKHIGFLNQSSNPPWILHSLGSLSPENLFVLIRDIHSKNEVINSKTITTTFYRYTKMKCDVSQVEKMLQRLICDARLEIDSQGNIKIPKPEGVVEFKKHDTLPRSISRVLSSITKSPSKLMRLLKRNSIENVPASLVHTNKNKENDQQSIADNLSTADDNETYLPSPFSDRRNFLTSTLITGH